MCRDANLRTAPTPLSEGEADKGGGSGSTDGIPRRHLDAPLAFGMWRRAHRANLKNAFALVAGARLTPDLKYVLVDDVFTTGSTLNSCARVLRCTRALNLDVVTFAHG